MNLPDLYARVVAKRPDLAASVVYSHIIDVRDGGPPIWGWFWQVSDGMGVHVHHSIAAALILARWGRRCQRGSSCPNRTTATTRDQSKA